jgi:SAM-dependent methyltransferase
VVKPEAHYLDPRLVELYHIENPPGPDMDFYLSLATSLDVHRIIDLGCGTGLLACHLATSGCQVIGVDPSPTMLAFARCQPRAELVRWAEGDAGTLGMPGADLLVMTGNVAQIFLDDADWLATLEGIHGALRPGGHLAFESRNPAAKPWECWNRAATLALLDTPYGPVETWLELLEVGEGRVSFDGHNLFLATGEVVVAKSELRFRSLAEMTHFLTLSGFTIEHIYGDWQKGPFLSDSQIMIFVACRT